MTLDQLDNEELEQLHNDGHIYFMTKDMEELHFFYNRVEEEIKRRKLNKKL